MGSTIRVRRLLFVTLAAVLAFAAGPGARAQESAKENAKGRGEAAEPEGEDPRVLVERIRLYLTRHGDFGKIDPEGRRARVAAAAETAAREAREPLGVGGSTWVSIGPTDGAGRMTAVAPDPVATGTLYVGAAGGGVWKTTDSGATWTPLTDAINDLSVGAIAVAPSDPSTVYVGSGEGGYAIDFIPGIGFLKSTDAGATWITPASVVATTFYKLSVHPTDPLDVLAGTNQGGIRSTDGGVSWTTVLPLATYGDIVDIVRDATNPLVLYASAWRGARTSAASQIVKSTDGGATWTVKSSGLPASVASSFYQRMSVAISPSNPLVLYAAASIGTSSTVAHVYKSTDGAESWADLPAVSGNSNAYIRSYMAAQGWYDNTIVVSPTDPNLVVAGGTYYIRSTDGGNTFARIATTVHVDAHELRYQGSTLWIGNDGGIWSSTNNGGSWTSRNAGLVTRQLYALGIDPVNRNRVITGAQDNGTSWRNDAAGTAWGANLVIGGDGFECGINPLVPLFAYGSVYDASIYRTKNANAATPSFGYVSPLFPATENTPFLSVLTIDPSTPSTIYTGTQRVWQSLNAGDSWAPLPRTVTSGPAWGSGVVTSIAVARSDGSRLLAGQGSVVFRTTDGGVTWASVSIGRSINNLEFDPADASVAYAACASTAGLNFYKSTDGGATWTLKASGLPNFAAQVVRVDPTDSTTVYCGTDVGVYRSTDSGNSWAKFGTGIPNASVHDLRVLEDGSVLRAATHGRGVWELQIPASGNNSPSVAITSPATAQTVAKGTAVSFAGTVSDPDGGDTAAAQWIFPDTWDYVPASGAAPSTTRLFSRAGVYPVTLTARDSHGALGTASVTITVTEDADSCATPVVVPSEGPFPYTVFLPNETGTTQASDPLPSCLSTKPFRTMWIEFTPWVSGSYEISTCPAAVDTVLAVFTGPACGPYTELASGCNDDVGTGGTCDNTTASLVTLAATAGQTLRIEASVFSSASYNIGLVPVTIRPTTTSSTAPKVTGLSRFGGPIAGGTPVAITGSGFASGATVSFGGTAATGVVFVDSAQVRATTPAHAPGYADVAVTNPDTTNGTLHNAFLYEDPNGPWMATVSGNATLCAGASTDISASLAGTPPWTVTWSDGVVQSGVAASPATRTVAPAATTSYYVASVSDASGPGVPQGAAAVTVNPIPSAPVPGSNSPLCAGATLSLTAPAVGGATYAWTGPNGFAATSQNPTLASVTAGAAGTYSVAITVLGCASSPGTTDVVVNPDDAAPVVTAPSPITIDQTACCGTFGGATTATSATLASFVTGGTATDDCAPSPTRLAPQLGGADVTSATCFEAGESVVTFRFQDTAGKTGTATATSTVRMFGDLNADLTVDPTDMVVLRAYFNFAATPGVAPFSAPIGMADLNHDATVDPTDLVILRAYFNFAVSCLAP